MTRFDKPAFEAAIDGLRHAWIEYVDRAERKPTSAYWGGVRFDAGARRDDPPPIAPQGFWTPQSAHARLLRQQWVERVSVDYTVIERAVHAIPALRMPLKLSWTIEFRRPKKDLPGYRMTLMGHKLTPGFIAGAARTGEILERIAGDLADTAEPGACGRPRNFHIDEEWWQAATPTDALRAWSALKAPQRIDPSRKAGETRYPDITETIDPDPLFEQILERPAA